MLTDLLQYTRQVGIRFDGMKFACGDQALDDTDVFGTQLGSAK